MYTVYTSGINVATRSTMTIVNIAVVKEDVFICGGGSKNVSTSCTYN